MDEQNKYLNDRERLEAILQEDVESPEDVKSLLDVALLLNRWQAPKPDKKATLSLVDVLVREMPSVHKKHWFDVWPLLLLRSQIRVVRREIWAATLLTMLLGILVTLGTYTGTSEQTLPIVILAPVVAAIGVAFLYDNDSEQMMELENSTPASVRMLLLARLTLVFGFNLALGMTASLLLSLVYADVLLLPLIMSWLVPMSFLSALAFFSSVVARDATFGSIAGMFLWGMHIFIRYVPDRNLILHLLSWPGLSAPESRPVLFVLAGLLVLLALWIGGSSSRHLGETL
ncbi:MAG: hypothetical protein K8L97_25730 [Anaerolineae bacterium]|nr:hypothetical protein [Anaerolineae bacterium]